jgi:hypothetical protein
MRNPTQARLDMVVRSHTLIKVCPSIVRACAQPRGQGLCPGWINLYTNAAANDNHVTDTTHTHTPTHYRKFRSRACSVWTGRSRACTPSAWWASSTASGRSLLSFSKNPCFLWSLGSSLSFFLSANRRGLGGSRLCESAKFADPFLEAKRRSRQMWCDPTLLCSFYT